ncbi:MAG: Rpn family recombination-promoting nuclease/putative transposase [Lachnospiraceae bacterium]|nr:Rpn family recombination-promoting nuclease/putative transposase [Lachnospiraceae bacterium]
MNKQRRMKSYEELCFRDDFMFGKVMEDKDLCRDVLECLMQRPIGELTEVQTQKEFHYTSDGKPIRLDVYNEDDMGVVYDAEMENLNNKTVEAHELPKRSRFYQGSIDIDFMNKGNSYKALPESNILFVCTFDPFKKDMCQYTFRERCDEDYSIELNDGTQKIYYNCKYQGDDIPEELRTFYDYVENGKTGNELTKRIENAVAKARKNEVWRTQYMKEWVVLQDAKDEGREEGREEEIRSRVEIMLRKGKTVEEIVDFCEYPYDLVKSIEEELQSV